MHQALSQAIRQQRNEGRLAVIAEVKRRRADGVDLLRGRPAAEVARVYQAAGAAALSVVTSPWFGGSLEMLEQVSAANLGLPILRKDLIATERDVQISKRCGASAVLLVLPLLGIKRLTGLLTAAREQGLEPFVELATSQEIAQLRPIYDGLIAINNSDIKTNEIEGEGISRSVALIERQDSRLWISASGIGGSQDAAKLAAAGFDGILIGTHLLLADDLRAETDRVIAAARSPPAAAGRPKVKVCGVTTEEEIQHLTECAVDFLGLVVDVPSPWTVTVERAKDLAARAVGPIRATLVTRPAHPDRLATLIAETGVRAIQLGPLTTPQHIGQLRQSFPRDDLVIMQEISYRRGIFWKEELIDEYLAAGADFILIDQLRTSRDGGDGAPRTIPESDLVAFRDRHPGQPILVAGGVSSDNARALIAASGAVGIDVCSSVRRDGAIRKELVARLVAQLEEVV